MLLELLPCVDINSVLNMLLGVAINLSAEA
jgi:hypothetical protein